MNKLALRKYMKSMIYKKIKNKTQTNELQDKLIYLTKNKII